MISEDLRKTLLGIVDWQLESEETGYVKEDMKNCCQKDFVLSAQKTPLRLCFQKRYI